jgi:hypothetical protein
MSRVKSLISLALFIIFLAFFTQRVFAPGVPFNVYGYVKDDFGNPIAGASVTVKSPIDQVSTTTNSEGKYAVTLSINGPGDQIQVTATYGARSGSASGTVPSGTSSMQIDVVVQRISTSISCSASPTTLTIGGSVSVSGAISPAVGGATVTLTYTKPDGSTFTHSVTTSSSGAYSDTYTPDKVGVYSVQASWSGNNDYKGATSSKVSFTVTKKSSSISISLSSNSIVIGEKVEISGSISPPISGASVTISYRLSGGSWSSITTVPTDSSGRYSCSWTPSSPGSYEVMASWPGNDEYEGASASSSLTVMKPDFKVSIDKSGIDLTIGETAENVTITLSSIGGLSSSITLSLENVPPGVRATLQRDSLELPSNGQVSTTLNLYASWSSTPGSYSIKVKASGGGAIHEATLNINIILPPPSFNVILDKSSLSLPIIKGYNSTLTITVNSKTNYSLICDLYARDTPSGVKVTLENNKLKINRLSLNSTKLSFTVLEPLPAKGNYSLVIIASCMGIVRNVTLNMQLVEKIPSKITVPLNRSSIVYGEAFKLEGNISPAPHKLTKAYVYVLFENNTKVKVGETDINEQGEFSFVYSPTEVGEYIILIEWPGTELYLDSSTSVMVSVSKAATKITLKTNVTEPHLGQTVLLSGKVTTEKGEPISNMNVNITIHYKGFTFHSIVTTNSTGDYSLPLNLAEGNYEVSAYTVGNKNYAPSSSETIKLAVTKEPVTMSEILFLVVGFIVGIAFGISISRLRKVKF